MYFHIFIMLCYFTPIIGAIIADSWLGKFRTILYISIIYAIGCIFLAVGSAFHTLQTMKVFSMLGLILIALGTGGIKPCVSAFGGDQFRKGQENELKHFFTIFYFSINLGSVFSTFLTPILKKDVRCFGEETCFPLAFGIPAVLMIIAIGIFLIGKPLYRIKPPEGDVLIKFCRCICHAISIRCCARREKREHWLDYASDKYEVPFITDVKTVLHILFLYLPLPIFFALFDQTGSKWVLQAINMDGRIGHITIQPSQMQAWNPLFVIILIPTINFVIYPLFAKCNLLTRPLQRITVGGLVAALAFIAAAILQLFIEKTIPVPIPAGQSEIAIINNSPCPVHIENHGRQDMLPYQMVTSKNVTLHEKQQWRVTATDCRNVPPRSYNFTAQNSSETLMITLSSKQLEFYALPLPKSKTTSGQATIAVFYNIQDLKPNAMFWLYGGQDEKIVLEHKNDSSEIGATSPIKVEPSSTKNLKESVLITLMFTLVLFMPSACTLGMTTRPLYRCIAFPLWSITRFTCCIKYPSILL